MSVNKYSGFGFRFCHLQQRDLTKTPGKQWSYDALLLPGDISQMDRLEQMASHEWSALIHLGHKEIANVELLKLCLSEFELK